MATCTTTLPLLQTKHRPSISKIYSMGTVQATPQGVLGGAAEFPVMPRSLLGGVLTASVIDHETLGTFDRVYLPAIGLLVSLSLQLTLLLTGELRKWTGWASVPGWLAYVVADIVVVYMLGLLSRTQVPANLYGLWSAFLVYHLGGPDNFTAYERADSRLLTGIPELLPTQLDLTKELMRRQFVLDIKGMKKDMTSWVDEVRQEVLGWPPPEPVTFSNIIGITGRPQDMVGMPILITTGITSLSFALLTCTLVQEQANMLP